MLWSQSLVVAWAQFAGAVFVLFGCAAWLVRRVQQPADRIALAGAVLLGGFVLPVLLASRAAVIWQWELFSANSIQVAEAGSSANPIATPRETEPRGANLPFATRTVGSLNHATEAGPYDRTLEASSSPYAMGSGSVGVVAHNTSSIHRDWAAIGWNCSAGVLLAAHVLVALWYGVRYQLGLRQWRRLTRNASSASDELDLLWREITESRGRNVRLAVSAECESPLLRGWFRPMVIVPQRLVERGGFALRSCLAHEWAHIERHDYLIWRAVDTCQLLFWWAPGYWTLRRELRICQDMLADRSAATLAGDEVEYSELLVQLARRGWTDLTGGALAFLDQPSQLGRRVRLLLDSATVVRGTVHRGFALTCGTLALAIMLLVGAVRIDAIQARANNDEQAQVKQTDSPKPPQDAADKPAPHVKADAVAVAPSSVTYRCRVVEQGTKKPIAGALVTVRRSLTSTDDHPVLLETKHTTDAQGVYEIEIPAAQVNEPALYVELDVEHADYPAKKGFGYSYAMIRKNEKLGERPFFEMTELQPGDAVTGVVVDPNGKPVSGESVSGFSMPPGDFNSISWGETKTDEQGRFRLVFHREGDAVLWVVPKGYAVVEKYLARQRGDVGKLTVTPGVRVTGRVLNIDGKPLAGVPVSLLYQGQREAAQLPVYTKWRRGAISDHDGNFALPPLAPGEYRFAADENLNDPLATDRKSYRLPAVFIPKTVSLKANESDATLSLQAVPSVIFHTQYFDSSGKKRRGHAFHLTGQIDKQFWSATGRPNANGTVDLLLPHGLAETQMQLMTNEHGALRYRRSANSELRDDTMLIMLGTLNDDIPDFQIVHYVAPIALVSAVDADGNVIANLKIKANYVKPRPQQYISFENGSDISFSPQPGNVFRSSQMLPDEDVVLSVTADGYSTATEKINLKEGATKEVRLKLMKVDANGR